MKKLLPLFLILFALLLAGCAAGPNSAAHTPSADGQVAGFWLGLWHGLILPVAFVISLFNNGVGIYEVHNSGVWYNLGFLLGAGIITGGLCGGGRRCTRRE